MSDVGREIRERFQLNGAVPSRVAMRFDPRMPFEQWQDIGLRLAMHASASAWWLGDWLIFGRAKYDRRYRMAVVLTGLDYQTLRNYAVVARRFEVSRRRDTLSFQHHAEVCALNDDEQDVWLARAVAGSWSRNELRRRLRRELAGPHSDRADAVLVQLSIDPVRERRWREAAARSACDLEAWILRVLDEGADSLLATSAAARSESSRVE